MFFGVRRPLLGAKIATTSDLGAPGSMVEPSLGSWRLAEDSWSALEGSWRALGALSDPLKALLERKRAQDKPGYH